MIEFFVPLAFQSIIINCNKIYKEIEWQQVNKELLIAKVCVSNSIDLYPQFVVFFQPLNDFCHHSHHPLMLTCSLMVIPLYMNLFQVNDQSEKFLR